MKKTLTAITLGILLGAPLAYAQCCGPAASGANANLNTPPSNASAQDGKVMLKITGMTCNKCAAGIKNSLTKLKGVKTADVNLDKGCALVTFDPAQVKTEQLVAAVDKAGGDNHTFKAETMKK